MRRLSPSRSAAVFLIAVFAHCGGATVLSAAAPAQPRITPTYPAPAERYEPELTFGQRDARTALWIAYAQDTRALAVGGTEKEIRLWGVRSGESGAGRVVDTLGGPTSGISAMMVSSDGAAIVALADEGEIFAWSRDGGKLVFSGRTNAVVRNAFLCPGLEPLLGECHAEGVRIWNYRSGEVVRNFTSQNEAIRYAAITTDGKRLAGVTRHGGLRLWNFETGEYLRSYDTRTPIAHLAAGTTHIAVGGAYGGIQLWPVAGGALVPFAGSFPVAFSHDGQLLAGAVEKTVQLWDTSTGALLSVHEGHRDDVIALAFSPTGERLASSDRRGVINTWSVPLPLLAAEVREKIAAAASAKPSAVPKKPRRLLVLWRADGAVHPQGMPAANLALESLGEKSGAYSAEFTRDERVFNPRVLAAYDAIVLNNTTQLRLPDSARQALLAYVRRGGGVVGLHAAVDGFSRWPEGSTILGATLGPATWGAAGTWSLKVESPGHPLTGAWTAGPVRAQDAFYEMADPYVRTDRRVLLALDLADPTTANPGSSPQRPDRDFPVAWIRRMGQGRVFYSGFGHDARAYQDPAILQFHLDGIQYALGDLELPAALDAPPR